MLSPNRDCGQVLIELSSFNPHELPLDDHISPTDDHIDLVQVVCSSDCDNMSINLNLIFYHVELVINYNNLFLDALRQQ